MEAFSLSDVAEATNGRLVGADDPDGIFPTGACIDTRILKTDELFVALEGEQTDGHRFVAQALENGASAALVSEAWFSTLAEEDWPNGPTVVVDAPDQALGTLGKTYRRRFDIPLIAVTGSNGKTTTKEMIATVLRTRYRVLATEGNLNTRLGVPMTLLKLTRDHDVAVIEMGITEGGGLNYLCELAAPTIGVITNIGPTHLEYLGSVEGVAQAKGELLDYLDESSMAILNFDDLYLTKKRARVKGRLLGFGVEEISQFRGERLVLDQEGCCQFSLQSRFFHLHVPGRHNVYNALAAAAAGCALDVPLEDAAGALAGFEPPALRGQVLESGGVKLLNDSYNANPASMRAALDTLTSMPTDGRRFAVLGDMLELGPTADSDHRSLGRYASQRGVDALLALGDFAESTAGGGIDGGMTLDRAAAYETLDQLSEALSRLLKPGDLVLLKGSRGARMERLAERLGFSSEDEA